MIKLCKKYVFKYKYDFIIYCAIGMLSCLIGTAIPAVLGQFINLFDNSPTGREVGTFILVLAGLYLLKEIIEYINKIVYIRLETNAAFDLNLDIVEHLKKISPSFIGKTDLAYFSQRINNDANDIMIFFISSVTNLIFTIISTIIILVLILNMDIKVFAITFLLLIIYFLVYILFKRKIYLRSYDMKEGQSQFFSRLQEQLEKSEFIKIHGINGYFVNRLIKAYQHLYHSIFKQQSLVQIFNNIENIIGAVSLCVLFALGGIEIINGKIQIGYFFIISSYFEMILEYGRGFVEYGQEYQDSYVSYSRIKDIFELSIQSNGDKKIECINHIEVRDLAFSYDRENPLISNLNIKMESGKIYAIKGENGKGKTTIVKLLLGLYVDEYEGSILYNGIEMRDLDMNYLREHVIGFTEQEPTLISDSIYHNITLYKDIKEEKITNSVQIFKNTKVLKPCNWKRYINEQTSNISGGEKQKIALVRQILRNNSLVIFDEPTSALDIESVNDFLNWIEDNKQNKIVIIISHDQRVFEICDTIIEI